MNPHQYSTGGASARDMASISMVRSETYGRTLFGQIGQMILEMDISGPIDAPSQMPAGAMNSVDARNGRGDAVPYPSLWVRP